MINRAANVFTGEKGAESRSKKNQEKRRIEEMVAVGGLTPYVPSFVTVFAPA